MCFLASVTSLLGPDGEFLQPKLVENVVMHEHQQRALQWLAALWDKDSGGILADQMGLGKTLEAISLIAFAVGERACRGPMVVVAPVSVLPNWASEFARFAPKLVVLRYEGSKQERAGIERDVVASIMKQVSLYCHEHLKFIVRSFADVD
jgi:SNF2 family DNA or RNA helicase